MAELVGSVVDLGGFGIAACGWAFRPPSATGRQERTRSRTYQAMIYVTAYVAVTAAAQFPLALYEGYFREHSYGLSNQNFMAWLGDIGIGLALTFAAALIFVPLLYAAIRRARENWWLWGAGLAIAFQILVAVIYPIYHRASVQSLFAPARRRAEDADPVPGARQRHPRRQCLGDGCLAAEQPHLRQCLRFSGHHPHHLERQSAETGHAG